MEFSAGRVLGRSLAAIRANLPTLLAVALLLFAPVLIVSLIVGPGAGVHGHQPGEIEVAHPPATKVFGQFVVGMLAFLAQYLLAAAVAPIVFQALRGKSVDVASGVGRGLRRAIRAVDTAFVAGILIGVGFLLLVVPGALLACVLFVAVPAALVERLDVVSALRRSAELTKGYRLSILVVLVVTVGLLFVTGLLLPGLFAGLGRSASILVATAIQIFFGLLAGACQAVAYHDLRVGRGEETTEGLLQALDVPVATS